MNGIRHSFNAAAFADAHLHHLPPAARLASHDALMSTRQDDGMFNERFKQALASTAGHKGGKRLNPTAAELVPARDAEAHYVEDKAVDAPSPTVQQPVGSSSLGSEQLAFLAGLFADSLNDSLKTFLPRHAQPTTPPAALVTDAVIEKLYSSVKQIAKSNDEFFEHFKALQQRLETMEGKPSRPNVPAVDEATKGGDDGKIGALKEHTNSDACKPGLAPGTWSSLNMSAPPFAPAPTIDGYAHELSDHAHCTANSSIDGMGTGGTVFHLV